MIILDLLADVLAIELLCGAQGLDFHLAGESVGEDGEIVSVPSRKPGDRAKEVYEDVRSRVPRWQDDRVLHPDMAALGTAVRAGVFSELEGV
jgi:histidine ammonia-lyase